MWKKVFIGIFALVIASSVGYTFYNDTMDAATSYQMGGAVTGRIGPAGKFPNGTQGAMQKGDRIVMGTKSKTNSIVAMQLIAQSTYSKYNCEITSQFTVKKDVAETDNHIKNCGVQDSITSWFSLSTTPIAIENAGLKSQLMNSDGMKDVGIDSEDFISYGNPGNYYAPFEKSNFFTTISDFNNRINSADQKLLTYRDAQKAVDGMLLPYNPDYIPYTLNQTAFISSLETYFLTANKKEYFIMEWWYLFHVPSENPFSGLKPKDLTFSTNYATTAFATYDDGTGIRPASSRIHANFYAESSGTLASVSDSENTALARYPAKTLAVRPAAYLDVSNVVFGISQNNKGGIASVTAPSLPSGYTALYKDAVGEPMKVRVYDSNMHASLNSIQNGSGTVITKAAKDSTVSLSAYANGRSDNGIINTVSALVFDSSGNFVYYKPLEAAKGIINNPKDYSSYEFDLSGIPLGNYKIGIVNETYNESTTAPADSSLISEVQELQIVSPLSNVTFTAKAVCRQIPITLKRAVRWERLLHKMVPEHRNTRLWPILHIPMMSITLQSAVMGKA